MQPEAFRSWAHSVQRLAYHAFIGSYNAQNSPYPQRTTWQLPKMGGRQCRPQNTIILLMWTYKKVPLIFGKYPHEL